MLLHMPGALASHTSRLMAMYIIDMQPCLTGSQPWPVAQPSDLLAYCHGYWHFLIARNIG